MASTPTYKIFAIKYAHVGRKAWGNFVDGDPHEDWDMPLDYYVWAVVGADRTFVVDTGFDAPMAKKRDRRIVNPVEEGLAAVGVRHADVEDVIITHMHYDHCGNGALFPKARFHMQDTEMEYVTGRCMCHHQLNHAFEADDVSRMVQRVFAGRVQFHDGTDELASRCTRSAATRRVCNACASQPNAVPSCSPPTPRISTRTSIRAACSACSITRATCSRATTRSSGWPERRTA
jgi:hypothetical protein